MSVPFFQACGGRDPLRVEVGRDGDSAPAEMEFETPFLRIGRHPRAEIGLGDPRAAPLQLYFQLIDGLLYAVTTDETAVTLCGGRPFRYGWVRAGETFEIHGVRLRMLNPDQRAGDRREPDANPQTADAHADAAFHFEPSTGKSREWLPVRPRLLVIGRTTPSKFRIQHPSLRPVHAALVRTADGPWLVDLSFDATTRVNGRAVTAALLSNGDRVALGEIELTARIARGAMAPPSQALVVPPPAADPALGPVLQHIAQIQAQQFEQFRLMLGTMTQMFGNILHEHRQFMREDQDRAESPRPGPPPPVVTQTHPVPAPALSAAPQEPPLLPATVLPGSDAPVGEVPDIGMHLWLEQQIGTLEKEQNSVWKRFVRKLHGN